MPPCNFKRHNTSKITEIDSELNIAEEKYQILVKEASVKPADIDFDDIKLPDYYDPEKFRLGQQAFQNNVFSMMIGKLSGLITLLAIPDMLDILIFTNQSGTPCTAFRRYISTVLHTFTWYGKEPEKQIEFFKSLKYVRKKHIMASQRSIKAGLARISQLDMVLTQFGFIGYTLIRSKELAIYMTKEEIDGLIHVWLVVGHLLGIEDRYNLCSGSTEECLELSKLLLDGILIKNFTIKSEKFEQMSQSLIYGLWPINPFLEPKAFTAFTVQLALPTPSTTDQDIVINKSPMPWHGKFLLELQLFVLRYLMPPSYWWSKYFRNVFNAATVLAIYIAEKFPLFAYILFGKKNSRITMYKTHVK